MDIQLQNESILYDITASNPKSKSLNHGNPTHPTHTTTTTPNLNTIFKITTNIE